MVSRQNIRRMAIKLGGRLIPEDVIIPDIKRNKQIVFGRRAMNAQLPGFLNAPTTDFDVYVNTPKRVAFRMQGRLDNALAKGRDEFYALPALHPQTWRVMNVGSDKKKGTKDDFSVVDYSPKPKKVCAVGIKGIKYQCLKTIIEGKERTLRDPMSAFRHEKDRRDLARIMASKSFGRLI